MSRCHLLPNGYEELLGQIKERIRSAQLRASLAVNQEMIVLYWQIGRDILARQEHEGWGTKVVDRLAGDLRRVYPDMTGLSPATSNTCGLSPRRGRRSQLCNSLLHKFRRGILFVSSTT